MSTLDQNRLDTQDEWIWNDHSRRFWAEKSDGEESIYCLYYEALSHAIQLYEKQRKTACYAKQANAGGVAADPYKSYNYITLSNGCGEQFKQRRIALIVS